MQYFYPEGRLVATAGVILAGMKGEGGEQRNTGASKNLAGNRETIYL